MSMQVPGGNGVRPLQPTPPQPPVSRPDQEPDQVPVDKTDARPETGGRAGSQLHSINQFSSKPVAPELSQMNSWLQAQQSEPPASPSSKSSPKPSQPMPRSHPPLPPAHPHEKMAMQDMENIARKTGIPSAAAHDLGRGIDQDRSRLIALADQIGIPKDKATAFLKGMAQTGRKMDVPPDRMQAMMEHRGAETDTHMMQVMRKEAGQQGIPPRRFMAMGHALMKNDKALYRKHGEKAGLQPDQLQQRENKIRATFKELEAKSEIGSEKITRMVMDDRIKGQIANAGKKLGIPPQESLRMAFTFIEGGPDAMKKYAGENRMADKAPAFLKNLEQMRKQTPKEMLNRGIESFQDVREQRHVAHELGLDGKPLDWRTSGAENHKPGFAFIKPMARMMRAVGDKDFQNIRHHKMEKLMEHNNKELQKFDDGKPALFSPDLKAKAQQKADHLLEQNKALINEFKKMEDAGTTPPPSKGVKVALAEEIDQLKQKITRLNRLAASLGDDGPKIHGPAIDDTKKNLATAQNKLKALQADFSK